ncbi:beta strand repeat-containing protein [Streptomyces kronopolitis]
MAVPLAQALMKRDMMSVSANQAAPTLIGGPIITVLAPPFGSTAGNQVLIFGANLQNVTSVTFDGVPVPISAYGPLGLFLVVSAPPHAPGNVQVVVTSAAGSATTSYLYIGGPAVPPTATGITPATGPTTGGTPFTITGTNLTGASVTFNGVPATGIVISQGGNTITGVTPPGSPGNATVQITTAGGTTTVPGGFTYIPPVQPPTATGITPASGTTLGGTPFTITGTNLTGATSATFNGVTVPVTVGAGGTTVTGVTPAGNPGNATVVVNTPNGNPTVPGGFTYIPPVQPPTATGITPASGTTLGGTPFTITGTNLTGATSATFNGVTVPVTVGAGGTTVTGVTPAGNPGNATVVVNTPNGNPTVPGGFTYIPPVQPPTATSINPASGTTLGGTPFTITGTNLTGATSATFNGVTVPVTVGAGGTTVTGVTPAGNPGNATVLVNVPGAVSAQVPGGFTYITPLPPTATSINPASGTTLGGTPFTITGTNLTGATSATFNGVTVPVTVGAGGTTVTGVTPAGNPGNATVLVNVPGAVSAQVPGGFTYITPLPPTATGINPVTGSTSGGGTFTITGTNLTGATVSFGGTPATGLVYNAQGTSVSGTIPAHAAGDVNVVVNVPGGGSATVPGVFTYVTPVPTISGLTGSISHPAQGGNTVNIIGTGFTGALAVNFGTTPAMSYQVISDTLIQATAPAGTGTVNVTVNTPGGTSNGKPYAYNAALAAVTPPNGNPNGGTPVIITGANFTNATSVMFGNTPATNFQVISDTQINATAPAGTGTVQLQVNAPGGLSNFLNFSYAPVLASLIPNYGPGSGMNQIAINGTNLSQATNVFFGNTPATFTVLSDTLISATVPAGTATKPVTVSGPGGTSNPLIYSYKSSVTSLDPFRGPAEGGNDVLIGGLNFTGATQVLFGNTPASFQFISDTQILATAPPGIGAGEVPVTVVTAGGPGNPGNYGYNPGIANFSPSYGSPDGGTVVTINGQNFSEVTSVKFNGVDAQSFQILSPTQIVATTPPGVGAVAIQLGSPGGSATSPSGQGFRYNPAISSIVPTQGSPSGGNPVTILGTNLSQATTVLIGGTQVPFTVVNDSQITATAPGGTGTAQVQILGPGGPSNVVNYSYAPTLYALSPTSGLVSGGTTVTIFGKDLLGTTEVNFGANAASSFTVINDTQVVATSPAANNPGAVNVVAKVLGGSSNALPFTYV